MGKDAAKNASAALKNERDALLLALKAERKNCEALKKDMKATEAAAIKRAKKLDERERAIAAKENAIKSEYYLDIQTLKLFEKKLERIALSKATAVEKQAITDLFKDFWKDKTVAEAKKIVKKFNESAAKEEEEFEFDLDAAINPQGELDLKALCEELGVYQG